MKKFKALALFVCFLISVPAAAMAGNADLLLKSVAKKAAMSPKAQGSWSKALAREGGETLVPALIRSKDVHATALAVEEAGGRAVIISDSIISVHLLPDSVELITSRPEVEIAEAALPLHPKMSSARTATRVDAVQDGTGLGTPYNGKNVVMGVVDSTLDYGHPDFTSGGATRVQYVEQTSGATKTDCFKSEIIDGSCAITDRGQGAVHGTHVTGIAAGAGSVYTGVAPEADILFVFDSSSDALSGGSMGTAVVEGVNTIFSKADTLDKPAVVNLSLGTSLGAHDGTSLLEQGLDALT
ncbi:MAG TPA: S8 family serine peptidase, partial [bacterium]|nr:S8 family serine peptidase [bacterium]